MERLLSRFTSLFPLWTLLGGLLALYRPELFTWFAGNLIVAGLSLIMLGMGITLRFEDFRRVCRLPRPILSGVLLQFTVMPFLGWSIAWALQLPRDFAVGLILVSCCPGGTASNVVAYLARADLALSVSMTLCSTLLAVGMTPILTELLAGTYVPVDAWALLRTVVMVVALPVLLGAALNRWAPCRVNHVRIVSPPLAVILIVLIVSSVIGEQREDILESGGQLLLALTLLHGLAFLLGHGLARALGFSEAVGRTISIEVGMQNSGLGTTLARTHFGQATASPCAISAILHCLVGSILAACWRLIPPKDGSRNGNGEGP